MRRFEDLDTFLTGDASPGLMLTISGHAYEVPPPSAEIGLWCERITAAGGAITTAETEDQAQAAIDAVEGIPELPDDLSLPERVLSQDTYAAMVRAGVDHIRIRIAAMTALVWIVSGEDAAERMWTSGGRPEALRPAGNRAERRASRNTAGAATTSRPDSTSGTRSRQRSAGGSRGHRSRGRRS